MHQRQKSNKEAESDNVGRKFESNVNKVAEETADFENVDSGAI